METSMMRVMDRCLLPAQPWGRSRSRGLCPDGPRTVTSGFTGRPSTVEVCRPGPCFWESSVSHWPQDAQPQTPVSSLGRLAGAGYLPRCFREGAAAHTGSLRSGCRSPGWGGGAPLTGPGAGETVTSGLGPGG